MGKGSQRGPCIARLGVCSDSLAVVHWVEGVWRVSNPDPLQATQVCQRLLADPTDSGIRPATQTLEFVRHVPRAASMLADAMPRGPSDSLSVHGPVAQPPKYLRLMVDGSHSSRGAGCGWALLVATAPVVLGRQGSHKSRRRIGSSPPIGCARWTPSCARS